MKKVIYGIIVVGLLLGIYWFTGDSDTSFVTRSREESVYVYETPVDSPDECSSYEEYDEELQSCIFECATAQECDEIIDGIDDELASWIEDGVEGSDESISSESEAVAVYKVFANEELEHVSGDDRSEYHSLWSEVADLSPDSISKKYIESFEIFDDASDDTLAFVDDQDSNGKWRIAINLPTHKESSLREQKMTLVHELAHIISLNNDQMSGRANCNTNQLPEGCLSESSYLYNFWNKFWKNNNTRYNEDSFVTEYAATDEIEDFAESFAYFILSKNTANDSSTLASQKVAFFNNYPELQQIRESMRSVLSREIVRARRAQ